MRKSRVSVLAVSVLVAGAALSGIAEAQTSGAGAGTPVGQPGVSTTPPAGQAGSMASTGGAANAGLGIGPGMRAGVGPPTDGLDSNPYAEASPRVRAAHGGQVNRPAKKAKAGTLN